MRKILLIDGNSMLFRAYYATLTRGHMRSSSGAATNAVYGFSNMFHRALEIFEPTHVLIAFDTGEKTFRHDMYEAYKGTRKEVDEDLVSQFALIREYIDAMPIHRYELSGYEADDIIGTLATMYPNDEIDVLTSDRDLLQVISDNVDVLLIKKGMSDIARMDAKELMKEQGITPSQVVDMKALMGDASDNIPGVPSVGEKTAKKLLAQYETLDKVYENAEDVKGKMGENLRTYKDQAYLSYALAKIKVDVPLSLDIEDFKLEIDQEAANAFYRKYDMNSLVKEVANDSIVETIELTEFNKSWVGNDVSIFVDLNKAKVLEGVYMSDGRRYTHLTVQEMVLNQEFINLLNKSKVIASEAKPLYRFCLDNNLALNDVYFDDLTVLSFIINSSTNTFDKVKDEFNLWYTELEENSAKAKLSNVLFNVWGAQLKKAKNDAVVDVYTDIEKPLIKVLSKLEFQGFTVNLSTLEKIAEEKKLEIDALTLKIHELAEIEFNLNSPKQLAEVLFDHLELPMIKKRSTAVGVLEKLADKHPIIPLILEYRTVQKLYSTYAIGLQKHVQKDGKIHTTMNQHASTTGRLSSTEPNLQNISVKDEEGRKIRSAFVASENSILMSIDYSQIELRVLSFLAQEQKMMEAFNNDEDIHTQTAKEIFNVEDVTSNQRREAKSVNFGIVYGMSPYGLSEQLDISMSDASDYINKYDEVYPNIKVYMDKEIALCEKEGYVKTFFGRRRYIPEIYDNNRALREFGKRAAMNAPIQGTAADIIKMAMVKIDAYLEDKKSSMILQVHDELVLDVDVSEIESIQENVIEIMENVVDWPIKLKVEVSTGKSWYES